jgi:hypothetical protein
MKDSKVAKALQIKKDKFVSRFIQNRPPDQWESIDNIYFDHICKVLSHAKKIFECDLDELTQRSSSRFSDDA